MSTFCILLNKEFKEYCDINLECISKTECRQGPLKSCVLEQRRIFKLQILVVLDVM